MTFASDSLGLRLGMTSKRLVANLRLKCSMTQKQLNHVIKRRSKFQKSNFLSRLQILFPPVRIRDDRDHLSMLELKPLSCCMSLYFGVPRLQNGQKGMKDKRSPAVALYLPGSTEIVGFRLQWRRLLDFPSRSDGGELSFQEKQMQKKCNFSLHCGREFLHSRARVLCEPFRDAKSLSNCDHTLSGISPS